MRRLDPAGLTSLTLYSVSTDQIEREVDEAARPNEQALASSFAETLNCLIQAIAERADATVRSKTE